MDRRRFRVLACYFSSGEILGDSGAMKLISEAASASHAERTMDFGHLAV